MTASRKPDHRNELEEAEAQRRMAEQAREARIAVYVALCVEHTRLTDDDESQDINTRLRMAAAAAPYDERGVRDNNASLRITNFGLRANNRTA